MVTTTVVEPACGVGRVDIAIRLFGEVGGVVDGHVVPVLATPRMTRLLARLVLEADVWVSRGQLARDLWPDSDAAQARTNLRKLLHTLRRSIPGPSDVIETAGSLIRWSTGPAVWVDVAAFRDALHHGDPATAISSYGGELLPGCDDEWVVAERERLRRLAVEALVNVADAAAAGGRDVEVVVHTRRLLEIEPLHERACRLLMQALGRRGERGEALRSYDCLAARLVRELAVAPEPATTALADRLRRADREEGLNSLVARRGEWRAAHDAWRAAAGGRAGVLCVAGEAGIGKSRLVEELGRRVALEGDAVAYSRAYEAASRPPWGSVIDWLRSGPVATCLDTVGPACLTELARLLPELRLAHPDLPVAPPATDPGRRHHLLDAVRRGLLAAGRPLLLVVDDLQWCDTDTVELCEILVRSAPAAPVLIAATVRDEEAAGAQVLDRWRRHLAPTLIALGPLDRAATAEMAALVGGRALPPRDAVRLWTETEGNPLFVVEAVRAGFGSGAPAHVALTPTVHAVITARLDRLSPAARDLAEVAATIGREFSAPVLAMAAGRTEDDIAGDLDELWRVHVVRDRGRVYDFSHDRLRDGVLQSISPTRRRKLHRCIAEAIELQHADDLGPVSARLATHFDAAGLGRRALEAYERAAQHAYRLFALDACIALLQRALRLLDESPRGEHRDEVELRLLAAIGVPLVARRGYGVPEVRRCYERALTLHRRLGRRPGPSVLRGLALHAVVTCRFDQAEEMGRELIAMGDSDRTARVEGDYVLGVTHFWRGDFANAERHLAAAVDRYRIEDAPLHVERYAQDPLGVCLSRLALTQLFRGRPTDADRTMRKAVRVATELDNPMTVGYVRAFEAILAALEPEGHDLAAAVAAADTVTSAMHIDYFAIIAELLSGWRVVCAGDRRGLATIRRATERMRRIQPLVLTLGLSLLARGLLQADEPAAGRAAIADALQRTDQYDQRYLLAELLRIDAELLALSGDRTGGARTAQQAVDTAAALESPWLRDRALATLAELRIGR
ncbi:MAG TPA: BTAD domain-containing putative transcriptional regulator [Pseudonocardia sp.]|nr:BTAD domain-containing putative transcriptional regulator [Pseudonocardia sp.]